jgi:hypothetical protein
LRIGYGEYDTVAGSVYQQRYADEAPGRAVSSGKAIVYHPKTIVLE